MVYLGVVCTLGDIGLNLSSHCLGVVCTLGKNGLNLSSCWSVVSPGYGSIACMGKNGLNNHWPVVMTECGLY